MLTVMQFFFILPDVQIYRVKQKCCYSYIVTSLYKHSQKLKAAGD